MRMSHDEEAEVKDLVNRRLMKSNTSLLLIQCPSLLRTVSAAILFLANVGI